MCFPTNHSALFPPDHHTMEFRQTTV